MSDRTNRESQTREQQARVADWKPPSALEAPEAPIGYKHRWIREFEATSHVRGSSCAAAHLDSDWITFAVDSFGGRCVCAAQEVK